ncbi:MAG: carboxymuconolactone decarboxylase family protein [Pseudomonadota bacterium]
MAIFENLSGVAHNMKRLPEFHPDQLSPDQAVFHESIVNGPRGKFGGPFPALLHAPMIGERVQALGEALRFHGELDAVAREIAILTVARHWHSPVEWNAHVVIALDLGLAKATVRDIRNDVETIDASSAQAACYRYARELLHHKRVSDSTYQQTLAELGYAQLVELIAVLGYFDLLAMILNSFATDPRPEDGVPPADLLLPH